LPVLAGFFTLGRNNVANSRIYEWNEMPYFKYSNSIYLKEGMSFMKIHIDLMFVIRQTALVAGIHIENMAPPYVAALELLLQAIILIISLNLDAILTLLGA